MTSATHSRTSMTELMLSVMRLLATANTSRNPPTRRRAMKRSTLIVSPNAKSRLSVVRAGAHPYPPTTSTNLADDFRRTHEGRSRGGTDGSHTEAAGLGGRAEQCGLRTRGSWRGPRTQPCSRHGCCPQPLRRARARCSVARLPDGNLDESRPPTNGQRPQLPWSRGDQCGRRLAGRRSRARPASRHRVGFRSSSVSSRQPGTGGWRARLPPGGERTPPSSSPTCTTSETRTSPWHRSSGGCSSACSARPSSIPSWPWPWGSGSL